MISLKLLPQANTSDNYSDTIISLSDEPTFLKSLDVLQKQKGIITNSFNSYLSKNSDGEYCYGKTCVTEYGDAIKGVYVKDLKEFLEVTKPLNHRNKASMAYIKELPNGLIVWFYWC